MDDEIGATFGERVRHYRTKRKLAQTAFGELLGMSQVWVSDVERGQTLAIPPDQVVRMADVLHVSPLVLLGLDQRPEDPRPLASVEVYAASLDDSDIETLRNMAMQLASKRREPGPDYAHIPGWDRLTDDEKEEIREGIRLRDRAGRLRVAGPATDDAGSARGTGRSGRGGSRGSTGS